MELPKVSSNYLQCGCHAHTTPPPSTFFNIHLHELLSQANNKQIFELFNTFQFDIYRILLSQFIDRITLQQKLSFDQQNYYFNTFNHIINPSSTKAANASCSYLLINGDKHNCKTHPNLSKYDQHLHVENMNIQTSESTVDDIKDETSDDDIDELKQLNDIDCNENDKYILPDDVWSRIFQFVDEKTRLLSLPSVSRDIYQISTSPSSWISLQISCSTIYFNFKKSYLFSNFLIKSGRCLTSLVLRDIASMNEAHWTHFIDFLTFYCPKIVNVRIRSSITQNNMHHGHGMNNGFKGNNVEYDESDSLFHQLIGSNLHSHEYHHYFHNKQIENILRHSNAVKSNVFNTLKVFIKHYKKYGGLLIPQSTAHINNINHANHLSNHRIASHSNNHNRNGSNMDDNLGNLMFNMLTNNNNRNHSHNNHDNDDRKYNQRRRSLRDSDDSPSDNDSDDNHNDNSPYNDASYSNLLQSIFENRNNIHNNNSQDMDNDNDSKSNNIKQQTLHALNPFFYIKPEEHDLFSYFSFAHQISKYRRNELQPEIHSMQTGTNNNNNHHNNGGANNNNNGNNNANINILESFCKLSLNQLKTNCVIRPKNLCSFLQQQPYLIVLKASVRYRRDWSESENEWFWKIPSCLPSNLEIFFLPGHHALPEMWVENCLSNLHNLKYFDFFIVNNKYIPSVSINTIYVLAKHCHQIQFVHLHINLDQYIQKCLKDNDIFGNNNINDQQRNMSSKRTNSKNHRRYHSMNSSLQSHINDDSDPYVLFTKELGNALQLLFANCLKLQRVYCYLPIKFDPSLLLQQIVFVQLPSKRKCKLRIDEYKIGGVKCRRFVFKLMDDITSQKSKIQ